MKKKVSEYSKDIRIRALERRLAHLERKMNALPTRKFNQKTKSKRMKNIFSGIVGDLSDEKSNKKNGNGKRMSRTSSNKKLFSKMIDNLADK